MPWWRRFADSFVIFLVFEAHIKKILTFAADNNRGAFPERDERQAEIKPFEPDTGNAGAGKRVPHHSSIDLILTAGLRDCETAGIFFPAQCLEVPKSRSLKVKQN